MTHLAFKAIAASPGVSLGAIVFFDKKKLVVNSQSNTDFSTEWARFISAVKQVNEKIIEIEKSLPISVSGDVKALFTAMRFIANDALLQNNVKKVIQTQMISAEMAVIQAFQEARLVLENVPNVHIAEKVHDLDAIKDMILEHLMGSSFFKENNFSGKIVACAQLTPRDMLWLAKANIVALVCETGTQLSHVSILARNLNIPAVVGVRNFCSQVEVGWRAIVDGTRGLVEVNASADIIEEYERRRMNRITLAKTLEQSVMLPTKTTDEVEVSVFANVGSVVETSIAMNNCAAGIGLYRLESLYLAKKYLPTEDEIYEELYAIAKEVNVNAFTVRLLDAGGDKHIPALSNNNILTDEHVKNTGNPMMGLRGVRVLLKYPNVLLAQCKAIIRANVKGNIKVLIPFVTSVDEIRLVRVVMREAWRLISETYKTEIPFPSIGVMVELPSAVNIINFLAREVDFFSIGTNDLTQHTLAVDRADSEVGYLCDSFHPAVINSIARIIEVANKENIFVNLCGEMGGDPLVTELLLGLGLRNFSVGVTRIPLIKDIIRSCSIKNSESCVKNVLTMATVSEIRQFLEQRFSQQFDADKLLFLSAT